MADKIFISNTELKKYGDVSTFSNRLLSLLKEQKANWELCRKNYSDLDNVLIKEFSVNSLRFLVQFNPGRIISSSAKVDKKSINERRCFLCLPQLPENQNAVRYFKNYLMLVNPYPIFPEHFTLPKPEHIAQAIRPAFTSMLDISKDIGDKFLVFYNGPRCGASAPDHMHFQAGTKDFLPVFHHLPLFESENNILAKTDDITFYSEEKYLSKMILLKSNNREVLSESFASIYSLMKDITKSGNEEPMMNIIAFYINEWRILIFPRRAHRPKEYFLENENRILFSPAAVDLGGVLITPRKEDFDKITIDSILNMMRQITYSNEIFEYLKVRIKRTFSDN